MDIYDDWFTSNQDSVFYCERLKARLTKRMCKVLLSRPENSKLIDEFTLLKPVPCITCKYNVKNIVKDTNKVQ